MAINCGVGSSEGDHPPIPRLPHAEITRPNLIVPEPSGRSIRSRSGSWDKLIAVNLLNGAGRKISTRRSVRAYSIPPSYPRVYKKPSRDEVQPDADEHPSPDREEGRRSDAGRSDRPEDGETAPKEAEWNEEHVATGENKPLTGSSAPDYSLARQQPSTQQFRLHLGLLPPLGKEHMRHCLTTAMGG